MYPYSTILQAEQYRYTVYNTPWYYLPPKTRKLIHLFQTEVLLNEKVFYVVKVYPIVMALLPRILHSVYSFANILSKTPPTTMNHGVFIFRQNSSNMYRSVSCSLFQEQRDTQNRRSFTYLLRTANFFKWSQNRKDASFVVNLRQI